jgi:8-hydroxy-5-deazaflavin:NADPH oxidoreductase
MSSISIIGLGGMARAIAARAVGGGNAVEVIGRDAAKARDLAAALGGGTTAGTFGTAPAGDIVMPAAVWCGAQIKPRPAWRTASGAEVIWLV